ncbi:type II toxin-antitoxin system HicB family antitoxin [Massilia phyllosphaerae]|uniref:type II toxin-antitoxin system HicB family antitoxin n=1 Tax=Massilia phyllosphaerae TaxID=3106034 RepID=UPI002B1CCBCC|nr:type II toxin-antitoxin system HicB family antitoxin [Massilia sp. SGZ-792]
MKYPAIFTPADEGGFVVTFRDIPEAITQGDDEAEAFAMAADALLTAMDFYFEDRRPVPAPSAPEDGERLIDLPLSASAKVLLLNEMLTQKVRPADLARLMGIKPQEVNRIIDLGHATKIDTLAGAFKALGRELDIIVR